MEKTAWGPKKKKQRAISHRCRSEADQSRIQPPEGRHLSSLMKRYLQWLKKGRNTSLLYSRSESCDWGVREIKNVVWSVSVSGIYPHFIISHTKNV